MADLIMQQGALCCVEPMPRAIIRRHRPTINEFAEDISKVQLGVDVSPLCRFDQRSNAS
jgi:hypothetical protein